MTEIRNDSFSILTRTINQKGTDNKMIMLKFHSPNMIDHL